MYLIYRLLHRLRALKRFNDIERRLLACEAAVQAPHAHRIAGFTNQPSQDIVVTSLVTSSEIR